MNIPIERVDDIQKHNDTWVISFKDRAPVTTRNENAVYEIEKQVRAYRKTDTPENRIISGLDTINISGCYDWDAEMDAIKSTLTLREKRNWKDLKHEELLLLHRISHLNDYCQSIEKEARTKVKSLASYIINCKELIEDGTVTETDAECVQNMISILSEFSTLNKRMNQATLTMLNGRFE